MNDRRCISCGEALAVRFEKWEFSIGVCNSCGLGHTLTPDGFDPRKIYDSGYFAGGHRAAYVDYQGSERVLRREFRRTVATLQDHAPGGRLLEVGCTYGYFLDEARARYDVEGLELCAEAVDACRARGLDVRCQELQAEALAGRPPYDVAVMLDVIEHLADPAAALRVLRDALVPGGHLLLTTGDFGAPLSRVMGRHWRLITPPEHLYFFTRKSLERLLERAGLEMVSFSHPWKLVPVGLALYHLGRTFGLSTGGTGWVSQLLLPVNLFDAMRVVARRV